MQRLDAGLRVEFLNHSIPCRETCCQILPKLLLPAAIKILDRNSLLFDPGIVTEVEHAGALGMRQLKDVILSNSFQVATECLRGIHLVEPFRIASLEKGLTFAAVELCAVRRHSH